MEYFELAKMLRRVVKEHRSLGLDVEELERLQTFIRLKIKGKPGIGNLFEFFEKSKDPLSIQQYTIKQASVEQIFNKFAVINDQTEYNG